MINIFVKYRSKTNYSQEKVAEMADMSWRQYERIENNIYYPSLISFAKLIEALKIPDDEVIKYLDSLSKKTKD